MLKTEEAKEYIIKVYKVIFTNSVTKEQTTAWFLGLRHATDEGETEPVIISMN